MERAPRRLLGPALAGMLLPALLAAMPTVASAQNFYAAVRGGPGWAQNTREGIVGGEDVLEFGTAVSAGGALGYAFSFGLRTEAEFSYIYNPVTREEGVAVGGSFRNYLYMVNLYYDVKHPSLHPFKPYIGGGVGAARVNEDHEFIFTPGTGPAGIFNDPHDWTALAYQARAGIAYEVTKWLDLSIGYRYVHVDGTQRPALFDPTSVNTDAINHHFLELGLAFKF